MCLLWQHRCKALWLALRGRVSGCSHNAIANLPLVWPVFELLIQLFKNAFSLCTKRLLTDSSLALANGLLTLRLSAGMEESFVTSTWLQWNSLWGQIMQDERPYSVVLPHWSLRTLIELTNIFNGERSASVGSWPSNLVTLFLCQPMFSSSQRVVSSEFAAAELIDRYCRSLDNSFPVFQCESAKSIA